MNRLVFFAWLATLTFASGYKNLKHGTVINSQATVPSLRHELQYSLYIPDCSAQHMVPLVIYLHDVWTTLEDDRDIFAAADQLSVLPESAVALLVPSGNWMEQKNPPAPWATRDFHTFWSQSPAFGDMRLAVLELANIIKLQHSKTIRSPMAIVGHGVGGLGARLIADSNRGRFAAVGSLSGVTSAACLAEVAAKRTDIKSGMRLDQWGDLLYKAGIVLYPSDAEGYYIDNISPANATEILIGPGMLDEEVLKAWSKKMDPKETSSVAHGYAKGSNMPALLYIDVGANDEYGLYSYNLALHETLEKAGITHTFVPYNLGRLCTACPEFGANLRCLNHEDTRACAGHRADGPLGRESSVRLEATGSVMWTGSLQSRMLAFLKEFSQHLSNYKK
jgi:S-formylglutathione hydrolase FrmB